jgi:hypothetical protein
MLQRLKRPGYWILLLGFLTVYFYQQYQKSEAAREREALFRLYRAYGEEVLCCMGEGNLTDLQAHFPVDRKKRISLEDIAMFVTTLHLDRNPHARWESWEEKEGNVTLHGTLLLEDNTSYPIDMMIVRQKEKVLLHRLRVGSRTLELKPRTFPFDREGNGSAASPGRGKGL